MYQQPQQQQPPGQQMYQPMGPPAPGYGPPPDAQGYYQPACDPYGGKPQPSYYGPPSAYPPQSQQQQQTAQPASNPKKGGNNGCLWASLAGVGALVCCVCLALLKK